MDDGSVYVVWLKDEQKTMIRQVFRDARPGPCSVRLQPLNHTLNPFYTRPSNMVIQGRVLCDMRYWD